MISEEIKQGKDVYLGTFMQMLNDYQFCKNHAGYFIPWDPDFLHSYNIVA